MQIKDFMKKDFVSVKETDPIESVLDIMNKNKLNSVPVVNEHDLLSGIIVKADIYRFMIQPGHYDSCPVDWVMSKVVVSIHPECTIQEASRKLLDNHIVAMPVVKDGKILSMISIEDLLEYYSR